MVANVVVIALEHLYTESDKPNELCCANCRGAVSRSCPIKIQRMLEKRNKITYSSVVDKEYMNRIFQLSITENVNKKKTKYFVNINIIKTTPEKLYKM